MGRLGPLPSATPGAACLTAGERGGVVRFRSGNGASIAGVVLGTGRVGVVMAHSNKGMWNLLLLPPPTVVIRLAETPMDLSTSATACARFKRECDAAFSRLRNRRPPRTCAASSALTSILRAVMKMSNASCGSVGLCQDRD
jgi:hypothetical protein